MKKLLLVLLSIISFAAIAQEPAEEEKKGVKLKKPNIKKPNIELKKPNLNIGESVGKMTGNLMTQKSADLTLMAPMVSYVCGTYDPRAKTTDSKMWPDGVVDADYLTAVTFMKSSGMGMNKIDGTVTCNGQPMEYIGLGSYMAEVPRADQPQTIIVTTTNGGKATYTMQPRPAIDIVSVNGDQLFPIIDLKEDFRLQITSSPEADGLEVKVGLATDILGGVRTVNYFADFKSTDKEVTIPKEAFSNTEIAGAFNIGHLERGETFLVVERKHKIETSDLSAKDCDGTCNGATVQTLAYASIPVVVKGKAEDGVITEVRFGGKHKNVVGFEAYKPNARTGLPFSRGSKFGLASLSIEGRTYKQEVEKGSSSYSVGGTRYTSTWSRTTTYQFPQLPDSHWNSVLELVNGKVEGILKNDFNIGMVPVETITGTAAYSELFKDEEINSGEQVLKTFKGTQRTEPGNLKELMQNMSSSQSTETASNLIMQQAGVDGLVSLKVSFDIGADKDDHVVLIPKLTFAIHGMDETKGNKNGTYAEGHVAYQQGIPFDAQRAQSDPAYLAEILNIEDLVATMQYMLVNLRDKEVALGFDKIWSIGEE